MEPIRKNRSTTLGTTTAGAAAPTTPLSLPPLHPSTRVQRQQTTSFVNVGGSNSSPLPQAGGGGGRGPSPNYLYQRRSVGGGSATRTQLLDRIVFLIVAFVMLIFVWRISSSSSGSSDIVSSPADKKAEVMSGGHDQQQPTILNGDFANAGGAAVINNNVEGGEGKEQVEGAQRQRAKEDNKEEGRGEGVVVAEKGNREARRARLAAAFQKREAERLAIEAEVAERMQARDDAMGVGNNNDVWDRDAVVGGHAVAADNAQQQQQHQQPVESLKPLVVEDKRKLVFADEDVPADNLIAVAEVDHNNNNGDDSSIKQAAAAAKAIDDAAGRGNGDEEQNDYKKKKVEDHYAVPAASDSEAAFKDSFMRSLNLPAMLMKRYSVIKALTGSHRRPRRLVLFSTLKGCFDTNIRFSQLDAVQSWVSLPMAYGNIANGGRGEAGGKRASSGATDDTTMTVVSPLFARSRFTAPFAHDPVSDGFWTSIDRANATTMRRPLSDASSSLKMDAAQRQQQQYSHYYRPPPVTVYLLVGGTDNIDANQLAAYVESQRMQQMVYGAGGGGGGEGEAKPSKGDDAPPEPFANERKKNKDKKSQKRARYNSFKPFGPSAEVMTEGLCTQWIADTINARYGFEAKAAYVARRKQQGAKAAASVTRPPVIVIPRSKTPRGNVGTVLLGNSLYLVMDKAVREEERAIASEAAAMLKREVMRLFEHQWVQRQIRLNSGGNGAVDIQPPKIPLSISDELSVEIAAVSKAFATDGDLEGAFEAVSAPSSSAKRLTDLTSTRLTPLSYAEKADRILFGFINGDILLDPIAAIALQRVQDSFKTAFIVGRRSSVKLKLKHRQSAVDWGIVDPPSSSYSKSIKKKQRGGGKREEDEGDANLLADGDGRSGKNEDDSNEMMPVLTKHSLIDVSTAGWERHPLISADPSVVADRSDAEDYFIFNGAYFSRERSNKNGGAKKRDGERKRDAAASSSMDFIPNFHIGRPVFDNWFVNKAIQTWQPVIDASDLLLAYHQVHNYKHLSNQHNEKDEDKKGGGGDSYWGREESEENKDLALNNGGWRYGTIDFVPIHFTTASHIMVAEEGREGEGRNFLAAAEAEGGAGGGESPQRQMEREERGGHEQRRRAARPSEHMQDLLYRIYSGQFKKKKDGNTPKQVDDVDAGVGGSSSSRAVVAYRNSIGEVSESIANPFPSSQRQKQPLSWHSIYQHGAAADTPLTQHDVATLSQQVDMGRAVSLPYFLRSYAGMPAIRGVDPFLLPLSASSSSSGGGEQRELDGKDDAGAPPFPVAGGAAPSSLTYDALVNAVIRFMKQGEGEEAEANAVERLHQQQSATAASLLKENAEAFIAGVSQAAAAASEADIHHSHSKGPSSLSKLAALDEKHLRFSNGFSPLPEKGNVNVRPSSSSYSTMIGNEVPLSLRKGWVPFEDNPDAFGADRDVVRAWRHYYRFTHTFLKAGGGGAATKDADPSPASVQYPSSPSAAFLGYTDEVRALLALIGELGLVPNVL